MSAPPSQPSNPVRIETTRDLLEALREGRSLVGANLENAYLSRGLFDCIQMPKSNLTRANLRSISLQQADLRLCNFRRAELGCVDLSFEPKESTDEIEKTQEVPGQFVKTRK